MSSTVFRQIAAGRDPGQPERLFRAAICAFCSLPRPTRREVAQLDELALPLFDGVPQETRRFAAATLSKADPAPPGLIRRLADEPPAISAPLLMRSPILTDIDLVRLIARHGVEHARVIARRRALNPAIADLVRALLASTEVRAASHGDQAQGGQAPLHVAPASLQSSGSAEGPGRNAEEARRRLRAIMHSATGVRDDTRHGAVSRGGGLEIYEELRSCALAGDAGAFEMALANALGITAPLARVAMSGRSWKALVSALRALDLSAERAFVVAAAILPGRFANAEAIRLFIERFEAMDRETARRTIRIWQDDGPFARPESTADIPADERANRQLRAS